MRFTIVTAVMNGGPALRLTVDSVLAQSHADFEILIQDGGCTDGCTDFLEGQSDARLCYAREKDGGIYDAWNKALARASGDWAIFLGAGDLLLTPTVLEQCAARLALASEDTIFAYGDMLRGKKNMVSESISRSLRTVYSMMPTRLGLPFPATFIRVPALKARPFDTSYRITGDYDFVADHIRRDNIMRLPVAVSYMEIGGVSDNDAYAGLCREERRRVAETRIIPRAEEIVRGCVAHLEESSCCSGRRKISRMKRLLAALSGKRMTR